MTRLRALAEKLGANLEACARRHAKEGGPDKDVVHELRTGTRRIEAVLASIERRAETAEPAPDPDAAKLFGDVLRRWRKLLAKVRRAAGPVRDIDVHRQLLEAQQQAWSAASGRESELRGQAGHLDAWLRSQRGKAARPLRHRAEKWAARLDGLLVATREAVAGLPATPRRRAPGARTALEAFARLSAEIELLHGENLHDFRKGAKQARYMAEADGANLYAGAVGRAIRQVQDAIGDWHDWEVLAEEAREALGEVELTGHLLRQRDLGYAEALRVTAEMRGQLMGEWRRLEAPPRARVSSNSCPC